MNPEPQPENNQNGSPSKSRPRPRYRRPKQDKKLHTAPDQPENNPSPNIDSNWRTGRNQNESSSKNRPPPRPMPRRPKQDKRSIPPVDLPVNIPLTLENVIDFCKSIPFQTLQRQEKWLERISGVAPTIDEQIPIIMLAVEADKEFYDKAEKARQHLEGILKSHFDSKPMVVHLFGSVTTGLAFKDSDYDMYADIPNTLPPEEISTLQDEIVQVLKPRRKKDLGYELVVPIKARVPIVHLKSYTGPCCDISFTKPLSLHKTALLKYLVDSDERIRPLIMILKFWLKRHSLLSSSQITSYAASNLAIFYLQQVDNPLIPPIKILQNNSPEKEMVHGWNVSFSRDKNLLQPIENKSTTLELLKGFFAFYGNFNFQSNAICPYIGTTIPKLEFSEMEQLPSDYDLYKNKLKEQKDSEFFFTRPMWVQDPMIHDHNMTRNLFFRDSNDFQGKCLDALDIVKEEEKKSNGRNLFLHLFKRQRFNRHRVGHPNLRIVEFFPDDKKSQSEWIDSTLGFFNDILVRMLKCKVEDKPNPGENDEILKVYECELLYDLLDKDKRKPFRKEALKDLKNATYIEREEALSNFLIEKKLKKTEDEKKFEVICSLKKNPVRLRFHFEKLGPHLRGDFLNKTLNILQQKLPKLMERCVENSPEIENADEKENKRAPEKGKRRFPERKRVSEKEEKKTPEGGKEIPQVENKK